MITPHRALSTRRRGSSSDGKNDPTRTFGIRSSTSPAGVDSSRDRDPLRWFERVSIRSCGAAPIAAVSSASISSCIPASSSRRNSSFVSPSPSRASSSATRPSSSWVIAWFSSMSCLVASHQGSRDGPPTGWTDRLPTPLHGTPTSADGERANPLTSKRAAQTHEIIGERRNDVLVETNGGPRSPWRAGDPTGLFSVEAATSQNYWATHVPGRDITPSTPPSTLRRRRHGVEAPHPATRLSIRIRRDTSGPPRPGTPVRALLNADRRCRSPARRRPRPPIGISSALPVQRLQSRWQPPRCT